MCGIAGFWNSHGQWDLARLANVAQAMGDAIAHRGPDAHGEYGEVLTGLALSHRRLSILDLTEAGRQPMHCRSRRWVVSFNGEIYNFAQVRAEVEQAHGAFAWRGHSDTEVLVEAIDLWGVEAAIKKCDGMFAVAAWCAAERRLVLARDRLGEKPLYWGKMPDGTLLFGSELRALYAHPSWHGELSKDAVALMMHYNHIPAPHSIYRHVQKLPPGFLLEIRDNHISEPRAYWALTDAIAAGAQLRNAARQQTASNPTEWVDQLETTLGDVIEEEMMSDVPLGAFLSGGIDSSLVVAMMQKRATRAVKTFTIGFKEDGFDEAQFARQVAAHLGTEHHERYLTGQDALAVVPNLPDVYDEPFADSSQIPTWLVSHFAREHVTVALSGDAGDESFAGYTRYHVGDGLWQKINRVPHPLRSAMGSVVGTVPHGFWEGSAKMLGPLCPRLLRNSPGDKFGRIARMLKGRSPADFYDELLADWKYTDGLVPGSHLPAHTRAEAAGRSTGSDLEYMMAHDTLGYLPNDILVKVDRAAMNVSLETRAPFVDRRIIELAWRMPAAIKMQDGKGKWPLREALSRHLPRPLFERPKQGFGVPMQAWLRGPLREWAESLLTPEKLAASGMFDPEPILRKWRESLNSQATWSAYCLWDVLMFQAWFERYKPVVK